jgi:hypothetical protein
MPTVTVTKTRTKTVSDDIPVTQTVSVETPQEPVVTVVAQPDTANMLLFGAVCAVCAFGITQVVKSFIKDLTNARGKEAKPWFYLTLIRFLAISFGGLSGFAMRSSFGPLSTSLDCESDQGKDKSQGKL